MPGMSVRLESEPRENGVVIVRIHPSPPKPGDFEIDLLSSEQVDGDIRRILEATGATRVVIDVKHVTYMHSRAFWTLVAIAEELLPREGCLFLIHAAPYVARLVELTSAADSVEVHPDEARALARIQAMSAPPPAEQPAGA